MSPSRSLHYGEYVANTSYPSPSYCYGAMKLTAPPVVPPRAHRKVMRGPATKRAAVSQQRITSARAQQRTRVDSCDNSNDSGLGFDHHVDYPVGAKTALRFLDQDQQSAVKRKKLEIKLESDDPNDNFSFPESVSREKRTENIESNCNRLVERDSESVGNTVNMPRTSAIVSRTQAMTARRLSSTVALNTQLMGMSRDGKTHLQILCQPEQQHRARYQTEGSRGAVKDRTGNGFPVVKLVGYNKPATLQVFIGTDVGRVAPHMFYQACRVSGKNSTPCMERKIDGTVVIEVDFDPAKDMVITCDCVGILKERNVDVEHRFPDQSGARNKKKSTRCRMVFRTSITHPDGSSEILQATSHPIVCTQPPGVPEICKKSLVACPCTGGMELFILGKNFLKDTRVVFQHAENAETPWEESVLPDKEFLQQTHLVCVVPPYCKVDIKEPVTVRLQVISSGKASEPHTFTYTPVLQQPAVADCSAGRVSMVQNAVPQVGNEMSRVFARSALVPSVGMMLPPNPSPSTSAKSQQESTSVSADVRPILMWQSQSLLQTSETKKQESKAMPPPELVPLVSRRTSSTLRLIVPDPEPAISPTRLKTEVLSEDSNSQSSSDEAKGMDLRMKSTSSMNSMPAAESAPLGMFQHFVSSSTAAPLPTQSGQSVEKFLSHLEHVSKPAPLRIEPPRFRFSTQQPIGGTTSVQFDNSHQKQLDFVRNMPVSNIYGSSADETLPSQQCKQQYMPPQHKSVFSDNPLNVSCSPDTVLMSSRVQDPQPSATLERTSSSLLYMPENTSSGTLVNSAQQPQENLPKNSNTMNVPNILRNLQESSLLTPSLSSSAAPPLLNEQLQRVNQVAPSLIGSSQDARLEALVSSAMDDQVRQQIQSSDTAKLDALVNSAAVRHMIGETSNSDVMMNSPDITTASTQPSSTAPVKKLSMELPIPSEEVLRRFDMVPMSSAAQVEEDRQMMNSTFTSHILASGDTAVHTMDSTNDMQASKLSPTNGKTVLYSSNGQSSPIAMKTIILSGSSPHTNENQMLCSTSPTHTSPVAVKKMVLSSGAAQDNSASSIISVIPDSSSSSENRIISAAVNPTDILNPSSDSQLLIPSTSPIAMKSMIMEPVGAIPSEPHLRNVANTSPIAMKTMILESAAAALSQEPHLDAPANTSPIAVKNMIMESSESHINAPTTSPVAVKNMLLDGASVLTTESQMTNKSSSSPMAMKAMILTGAVDENIIPASAAIQSGPNTQSLGAPQAHISKGKNMDMILEQSASAPSTCTLLQAPHGSSTIIESEGLQATANISPQSQFSSAASSSQNIVTAAQAPNTSTGLIKQMLLGLTEEKIKEASNGAAPPQEYKMSEMGLFPPSGVLKTAEQPQQEKKQQENSQQEKPQAVSTSTASAACGQPKKAEEGMLPQELTQMSENDLISYINPSCFDQV